MTSIFSFVNSFIPFADPSRPLWRDVLLSVALCTVLYIAPQVNNARSRSAAAQPEPAHDGARVEGDETHAPDQVLLEHDANAEELDVPVDNDFIEVQAGQGQEQEPAQENEAAEAAEAGPANPNRHQPRPRDPNREVGAKKAKAIARRNQQRAYNEFMREQGDAQRAEWARDEHERQIQIAADQKRRAEIDAKLREKERVQREARKAKEEAERLSEWEATRAAAKMIEDRLAEKGIIGVAEVKKAVKRNEGWVQELARREGIIGTKVKDGQKYVVMLTRSGWLVRISDEMMESVYSQAAASCAHGQGKVSWQEMGRLAQDLIVSGA